jgi:cysteine-rich repeat protein
MRTPLVLAFTSLLGACVAGEISGAGDDTGPGPGGPSCGDGVKDEAEDCDDGNQASGDGCSSTCGTEVVPVPALDVAIDKPMIMTELKTSHMVTLTFTGSMGFGGQVTVNPTVVDAQNMPLPAWTVQVNPATVTVPVDGTAMAVATLTIPSENKGLMGTVKFDAVSSLGTKSVSTTVTALNQVTIDMTLDGNGQCVYPPAGTLNMNVGTKIRWLNKATSNVTIHVNNNGNGVSHQPDPGSIPDAAYEETLTGNPGNAFQWYCHDPGPTVNNRLIQVVAL